MRKHFFRKRVTKSFAEAYEVVSQHKGYSDIMVLYPQDKGDPFYEGDLVAIERLDDLGLFVTIYPYKDECERKLLLNMVSSHTIISEVIL